MDSKDLYKELEKDNAAQIILCLSPKSTTNCASSGWSNGSKPIRNTGTCSVIRFPGNGPKRYARIASR